MRVVDDASAKSIEVFLDRLGCGTETAEGRDLLKAIRTDGWKSYKRAAKDKEITHYRVVLRKPVDAGLLLPWVHRVISNAKSVIEARTEASLKNTFNRILARFATVSTGGSGKRNSLTGS